ncbi:MAG: hypothetical protein M0C28_34660 [Candidatus Moduliflexus flocculans]|nr:hypothetical protein [Candidatus Moduliflexus flocculans]
MPMNQPSELDSKTTRELLTFFRELVETHHITMLMVSHDPLVGPYVHEVLTLKGWRGG